MTHDVFVSRLGALMTRHRLPILDPDSGQVSTDVMLAALEERLIGAAELDAQVVANVFQQIRDEYEAALYYQLTTNLGFSKQRVRRACLAAREMCEKLDAEAMQDIANAMLEEDN